MSRFRVLNSGGFASLEVTLQRGRSIKAESDAMVTASENMEVSGHLEGGLFSSFVRAITGNSSFFFQTLTSSRDDENALLAPKLVGDISLLQLAPAAGVASRGYIVQSGSFLACDESVHVSTHVQPDVVKGLFSGLNFFFLHVSGSGCLAVSSVGAIHRFSLAAGEVRYVDNGHIVAFDSHLRYEVVRASRSVWGSLSSGEGLMCRFIGPGDVYVQTHSKESFARSDSSSTRRSNASATQELRGCFACVGILLAILFFIVFSTMAYSFVNDRGFLNNFQPAPFPNRIPNAEFDGGRGMGMGMGNGGAASGGSREYYRNQNDPTPGRRAPGWKHG